MKSHRKLLNRVVLLSTNAGDSVTQGPLGVKVLKRYLEISCHVIPEVWTLQLCSRQTILQFYNAFGIMPSLFWGSSKHSRWLIDCSSSSGSSSFLFKLKGGQGMTFHAKGRLPFLQSEPSSLCSECAPNFLSLEIEPQ